MKFEREGILTEYGWCAGNATSGRRTVSAEKQGHQIVGPVELPGFSSRVLVTSGVVIKGCEEPCVLSP